MTYDDFDSLLKDIQRLEREVTEQGRREYTLDDGDNLSNFYRLGREIDLPPEKILYVYAKKHWDGVVAWINGYRSQREDVRQRLKDLRMYMALLWAIVEERERRDAATPNEGQIGELNR